MADYENNKDNNNKPFTLFNNETGQSIEIPVIKGTDGPDVLDIRTLYKETGMFTYDPWIYIYCILCEISNYIILMEIKEY